MQGQALAAVALFKANVTPVVTMRIGFGGDNHTDANLQAEVDQHVTGVQGIEQVMAALRSNQLEDKVTFATMNVFGRNLNGIAKVTSRAGRDHYGNHSVMVMIGKNVKPSVIGGAVPAGSSGSLVASDINAATGASVASGGDIPAARDAGRGSPHPGRGARHSQRRRRQRLHRLGRRPGRPGRPRHAAWLRTRHDRVEP